MANLIIINPQESITIPLAPYEGSLLSQAIWLSGKMEPVSLCNGLGLCGNCRCRFLSPPPPPCQAEINYFTREELSAGLRLACRHKVKNDTDLVLELPTATFIPKPHLDVSAFSRASARAILGIDLGTTTIEWQMVATDTRATIKSSLLNPQGPAGADIISRLQYAVSHTRNPALSRLALNAIGSIIYKLASDYQITRMCIAANSALTEILLEKDLSGLLGAPYQLSYKGNEWLELSIPGVNQKVLTYIPPLIAPFVGGDTSAGLAFLLERERPFILIDLGTNAELALLDKADQLTIVSAPLGPALEGIGPHDGKLAGPGVITGFSLNSKGLIPILYDAPSVNAPVGISATGYLSLLAHLSRLGLITRDGQFTTAPPMPLTKMVANQLAQNQLVPGTRINLTLNDIEILLKVKATFQVALVKLLERAHIKFPALKKVYLAGALGEYSNMEDLVTLGFLPRTLASRVMKIGNAALQGACILVQDSQLGEKLACICQNAYCIQLAQESDFMSSYLDAMHWGEYD